MLAIQIMKIKPGDIFEIVLEDGALVFAQALNDPEFVFFKLSPLEQGGGQPLFRIWVHKSAVKDWNKIGNRSITSDFKEEIARFKKDMINGKFSIYISGQEKDASYEQIKNLECAAVWEGNHIKERLLDHLAGRKNIWLESLKPINNG